MKSKKGMTIISLIVYVIVLSIVIGSISAIMRSFYRNEKEVDSNDGTPEEYTRFIAYFTDDINSGKITEVTTEGITDGIKLTFNDDTIHEYEIESDGKLYYILEEKGFLIKKVELCNNVMIDEENDSEPFKYTEETKKIEIKLTLSGKEYTNNFFVK